MAISTKTGLAALLLGGALLAMPAMAQDEAAQDAAEADQTTADTSEDAVTAGDADAKDADTDAAATDAPAEDAPDDAATGEVQTGAYYSKETHGDWELRCIKSPEGEDPCELFQLLQDSNGNPVAEAAMIPIKGDEIEAGLTITAPLETDLGAGVGFQIDSAEMHGYPFTVCVSVGCISRIGLTKAEVDGMRRGATARIAVLPFGMDANSRIELPMSLMGFTVGYEAIEKYVDEVMGADAADAEAAEPAPAD